MIFRTIFIFFCLISTVYAFEIDSELIKAVKQNKHEKVIELLASGANINVKGTVGFTPLLTAAGRSDVKMVEILISHGADLKAKSDRGFGVIHRAAMNKNSTILEYLLTNYDLDVVDRGKKYCSPLDFSLRYNALQNHGTIQNALLLIEHGAVESIDWKCKGYTPLMISVTSEKVINFLIENGADITIKNAAGKTAYDIAKEQKSSLAILTVLKSQSNVTPKVFRNNNVLWELKTPHNKYEKYSEQEAKEYCANLKLDNKTEWRVPTIFEYESVLSSTPYSDMVIDGVPKYYLDPKVFTNMTPATYWTVLKDETFGGVSISWNQTRKNKKNANYHVRCVHSVE